MPTKKKRVGFIPREDVMRIIDKLSIENNLSNSKIISILVEEALSIRGIFNKKNGKVAQSYMLSNDHSENSSDNTADFIGNAKSLINTRLESHFNTSKSTHLNNMNQQDFDLQTYKKFLSFLKFQEMLDKYDT
jgi:metal-responsive CopG/Arc/MetJ family transcriptional regulator